MQDVMDLDLDSCVITNINLRHLPSSPGLPLRTPASPSLLMVSQYQPTLPLSYCALSGLAMPTNLSFLPSIAQYQWTRGPLVEVNHYCWSGNWQYQYNPPPFFILIGRLLCCSLSSYFEVQSTDNCTIAGITVQQSTTMVDVEGK